VACVVNSQVIDQSSALIYYTRDVTHAEGPLPVRRSQTTLEEKVKGTGKASLLAVATEPAVR